MVDRGWALAYRRYSTAYVDEEAAARAARRGVWRGELVPPWEWRRSRRRRTAHAETDECRIKGNINAAGMRIYHVPGQQHYDRTGVNVSNGERWFCSEAEARAAGWRKSRL